MSKPTYIEMIKEIAKNCEGDTFQLCNRRKEGTWRIGNIDVFSEKSSPEEVIEEAHKKLFPPILCEVGDGGEKWRWNDGHWESVACHAVARTFCSDILKEQVYYFSEEASPCPVSERSGATLNELKKVIPNHLTSAAMRGFCKLIEINPELKPPTEDKDAV